MMLLSLVLAACLVRSSLGQCLTAHDDRVGKDPGARKDLIRSQIDFSLALFKAVGQQRPADNVFISPVSIYNAMLLAYFTAKGQTEQSLHKALKLPKSQDKLDMLLAYRVQRLQTSSGNYQSQVKSANRLFVSVNQTVRDCMTEIFGDEIEMVDFGPRGLKRAVESINRWVATQTHNNIQELVSADNLSPGSQLVLANVAYFKGVWKNQFDERDTKSGKFFVSKTKSIPVPFMYQQDTFSHWRSEQLGAEIVELPYKGNEVSLILLLPDQSNAPNPAISLLSRLDSSTLIEMIKESTDPKNEDKVEVKLPKFNVEKTLELTPILESLGVGDLFTSASDLTGLTGGPRIHLNTAIHKAKIQVDERGTEAAAATALTDTRIPANSFILDRPFIYLLYDKQRFTLLFTGIYNDPSK